MAGAALERRTAEPGERSEEHIGHHFIVLWDQQPALGERADLRGKFAPYAKYPGAISLGPAGILPAVRALTRSEVIACTLDPALTDHLAIFCGLSTRIKKVVRLGRMRGGCLRAAPVPRAIEVVYCKHERVDRLHVKRFALLPHKPLLLTRRRSNRNPLDLVERDLVAFYGNCPYDAVRRLSKKLGIPLY